VTSREFRTRLRRRTTRADVQLTDQQEQALESYIRLLARWNQKINLTGLSVLDPDDQAVDRLLVEPLVAAKELAPDDRRAVDIGSGSGSPAIPLLVVRPDIAFTLVESKTRKAVFLTELVRELSLNHVIVETARFEQLLARPDLHEAADFVTIRAVRVEARALLSFQAFLRAGGRLFWFRSASPSMPDNVPPPFQVVGSRLLIDANRSQLLILAKSAAAGVF
jgi:16S rRNA (guanine527-N7)-methyltransferase